MTALPLRQGSPALSYCLGLCMEGQMDKNTPTETDQGDCNLSSELEFANAADATGLWFALAVVLAVLAAGVIMYRSGNSDIVTAANEPTPAATHSDPLSPAILPER
jgi:hypothetical protein